MKSLRIALIVLALLSGVLSLSSSFIFSLLHFVLAAGLFFFWSTEEGFSVEARKTPFTTGRALLAALFVIGVITVLSQQFHFQWDRSFDHRFSLSERSRQILSDVTTPLDFYHVDAGDRDRLQEEERVIHRIEAGLTAAEISIHTLHPLYDAPLVQALRLQQRDRLVIAVRPEINDMPEKFIRLPEVSAKEMLRAIEQLSGAPDLKAAYLVGHGEPHLFSTSADDASQFRLLADAERITFQEIELRDDAPLSVDTPLFIVSPKRAIPEEEQARIISFLDKGGKVIVGVDYQPKALSSLKFLAQGGVTIEPQPLVRILEGEAGDQQVSTDLPVRLFRRHPITSYMTGSASTLFSEAVAVKRIEPLSKQKISQIQDLLSFQVNHKERVTVGSLTTWDNGGALLVFGDASWMTNRSIARVFNRDLLRGVLLWSTSAERSFDSISSPQSASKMTLLMPTPQSMRTYTLMYLFLLEGVMLIALLVFWRREQRSSRTRFLHTAEI